MTATKASTWKSISIEANGRTYSADVEIRGTRSLECVVHYNGRAEADSRKWGTGAEEQHNMLVMAKAKLIQMVGDDK